MELKLVSYIITCCFSAVVEIYLFYGNNYGKSQNKSYKKETQKRFFSKDAA